MELPSDLISQFAKIANTKPETKTETTVYGTTVEYNGATYVKIDGSELLTPVTTTTDMKPGERVTVMIKNHSATVTGNISSPSARTDDLKTVANDTSDMGDRITEFEIAIGNKADTTELNAEKARIDSLQADNVTIKQNLAAAEADIETLQADNVTVKESLTAAEANITKLQTDKLDSEIAEVTYATITDLDSANANAAKTATNYLNFSSSGLVVGDHTASSLGKNVLIDSDSVDIRNGTATLASFGSNEIILGQNDENSKINLCDGAGAISAIASEETTSYPNYDGINIASKEITMDCQRFASTISNASESSPTYQNSSEIYILSDKTSAGSYSRMASECTTTSSGDKRHAGFSAAALESVSTSRAYMYAESWDESANTWNNSNQLIVYPTKTVATKPIFIGGTEFTGENKILWSGEYYMSDTQTATLSEAITDQANGIVLLWSYYLDGAVDNSNFIPYFIPKQFVSSHPGKGIAMFMTNGTMSVAASKYVYVSNTSINGHANNDAAATTKSCGITSTPKNFVLRYIIGV